MKFMYCSAFSSFNPLAKKHRYEKMLAFNQGCKRDICSNFPAVIFPVSPIPRGSTEPIRRSAPPCLSWLLLPAGV